MQSLIYILLCLSMFCLKVDFKVVVKNVLILFVQVPFI